MGAAPTCGPLAQARKASRTQCEAGRLAVVYGRKVPRRGMVVFVFPITAGAETERVFQKQIRCITFSWG